MADDIKIKVGVQNNVKAGMAAAVADVNRATRQMGTMRQLAGGVRQGGGGAAADLLGIGGMSSIAKIGAGIGAAVAAVGMLVRSAKTYSDTIANISDNTGASIAGVQKLIYGAKGFGVEAEQLEQALGKVGAAQSEAFTSPPIISALKQLKIGVAEFASMKPEEAYQRLGQALQETGNKAAVLDIVGKAGMRQIGFMKSLSGGIDDVGLAAERNVTAVDAFFDRIGQGMMKLKAAGVDKLGQLIRGNLGAFMGAPEPDQPTEKEERDKVLAQNAQFKKERENKYKAGLTEEIERAKARNEEQEDTARQRAIDLKNFAEQEKTFEKKRGQVSRILGRGDLGAREAVDIGVKKAMDDDFRRSEDATEKDIKRQENRLQALYKRAQDPRQRKYSPQLQRVFKAMEDAEALARVEKNIEARKAEAEKAQIEMAKDMAVVKANTEELKNLKGLMTLK